MSRTSAYSLQIRTHSDDENALLLLVDGRLVAILVELADEGHGDDRGKWIVEAAFGIDHQRIPDHFATAEDAASWVAGHIGGRAFALGEALVALA